MYRRPQPPFLPNYQVQNLLGEGDDDTTGKGQEPVGSLGRVVRLKGHAHLHDAESQKDEAYSPDESKDECGQVVYYSYGVINREHCHSPHCHHGYQARVNHERQLAAGLHLGSLLLLIQIHFRFPPSFHWCFLLYLQAASHRY